MDEAHIGPMVAGYMSMVLLSGVLLQYWEKDIYTLSRLGLHCGVGHAVEPIYHL
jgi:hypothetical protein